MADNSSDSARHAFPGTATVAGDPGQGPLTASLSRAMAMLRAEGVGALAMHARAVLLHRLHERLYDARFRAFEAVPTGGLVELDRLHIESKNKALVTHYSATPRLVVRWLHEALPQDLSDWTFVDVGAGRGRVVLAAAGHAYRKVVGIEFAGEFVADAERNAAHYPAHLLKAADIEFCQQDAVDAEVPAGPTVYFIFNPFAEAVLAQVVERIAASYRAEPRPIVCALLNPVHERVLSERPEFSRRKLPFGPALKTALFSPYGIALYQTREAAPLLP